MQVMILSPLHRSPVWLLLVLLILNVACLAPAQPAAAPVPSAESSHSDTLRALLARQQTVLNGIEEQRKKIKAETVEAAKEAAQQQLEILEKRRQEITRDLMTVASGIDLQAYDSITSAPEQLTLQEEVGQFLTPLLSDMRELSRKPRAMEALQREKEAQRTRLDRAETAMTEIDRLLADIKAAKKDADTQLRSYLTDARKQWQGRHDEATSRFQAVQHQLEELQKSGGDFWSQLGLQLKHFVFTRGTSIALAILAFFTVLFGLRAVYFYILKYLPLRKYEALSFAARLLDVLHQGVSVVLAIIAALTVLYARSDWLLGGLAILALGALLFVAKSGLTRHMEQVRTVLNLGSVREGERVLIEGVPWRVGRINLFTQLTNPIIGGIGLRMSLDELMTMTSRPCAKDESWFPCCQGDWIMLGESALAQVMILAPDHVELRLKGEQRRWMALSDFIKAEFTTLGNGFALVTTFGIDYRHQALATQEIPQLMTEDIHAGMLRHLKPEEIQVVRVDFKEAGASSLDFLVIGSFAGSVAGDYFSLGRLLQRYAVESCQKHGWSIPFPQMVVHRAEGDVAAVAGG